MTPSWRALVFPQVLDAFDEQSEVTLEDKRVCRACAQIYPPFSFSFFVLSQCLALHCVRELKDCPVELREGFRDLLVPEHSLPIDVFRLWFARRYSLLFTAFQFLLSVHLSVPGTFPAPDRSPEVWTVLVVFVAFLQSILTKTSKSSSCPCGYLFS